ncbi:MAG: tetratricopeptide repeat protein [Flavobacteriia bacterium]|nr:tetratricopeptide repeat protein [Flavobacteriia bacterium]
MYKQILILLFLFSNYFLFAIDQNTIVKWQQQLNTLDAGPEKKGQKAFEFSVQCVNQNKFLDALNFSVIAKQNFIKAKNEHKLGYLYEQLGTIYSEINEYKKSTEYYLRAITIFSKFQNVRKIASARMNLVLMYLKVDKFQKALRIINLDAGYYKENAQNSKTIVDYYFTKGVIFGGLNQIDSSLFYFQKCSDFYKKTKDYTQYGGLLNNIGALYSKQGQNKEALSYYNEALKVFQFHKIQRGIGVSLSNIAFLLKKEKRNSESLKLYLQSIEFFEKSNSTYYLLDAYSNIIEINKNLKNLEQVVKYFEIKDKLEEKLATSEVVSQIAQVELKHQITQKEQQYQLKNQSNKLKQNRLTIILLISISLLILISFIVFFLRNTLHKTKLKEALLQKEKIELSSELSHSNRELEKFAIKIIEKNELLEQLIEKTKQKEITQTDEMKVLYQAISHNLYLDNDRKDLELQIDRVHQKFLAKLFEKFPELTKNEIRLCSLLMLDLSSKDIAIILNISPDSVKKNRNRLRKSLNLDNNQNIKDFLLNLS